MDSIELNKLKLALDQIGKGENIGMAIANAEYVNYDQKLINKINALKKIPVLNTDIIKYLFSIQLTDKIADVAPKVNAIYQLAKTAGLIEEKALEEEEKKSDTPKIIGPTIEDTAMNILRAIVNNN